MTGDFKTTRTLYGGEVEVSSHIRSDVLNGSFPVIVLEHEDGALVFHEEQAADLIGALSIQLVENRRARALAALRAQEQR
jgi:hypothetical protein